MDLLLTNLSFLDYVTPLLLLNAVNRYRRVSAKAEIRSTSSLLPNHHQDERVVSKSAPALREILASV